MREDATTQARFALERRLIEAGHPWVAGVDEAGRGPLAGPVAAAAVILDPSDLPEGIDDSKVLPPARRETLYASIMDKAVAVAIAFASVAEIDRLNIRQATLAAMSRAVRGLPRRADYVLVDGNDLPPHLPCPGRAVVKGDALSLSIGAASILAKVTRDRLMVRLDAEHPGYGFAAHKGYGTARHRAAICLHGRSALHRTSFASVPVDEAANLTEP